MNNEYLKKKAKEIIAKSANIPEHLDDLDSYDFYKITWKKNKYSY